MESDASEILIKKICASFPSLDSNGRPFSMISRGSAAELENLRSTLMVTSHRQELLKFQRQRQVVSTYESQKYDHSDENQEFDRLKSMENGAMKNNDAGLFGRNNNEFSSTLKRGREESGADGSDSESDHIDDLISEELLLHLPFVNCTCSLWDMENVSGDLIVTSLRVLFVAPIENLDRLDKCYDIAVDGRCIALHAIDSFPPSADVPEQLSLSHVYCQLSDPMAVETKVGYTSAISMVTSSNDIVDDDEDQSNMDEELHDDSEAEVFEVFFTPMTCDVVVDKEKQTETCQILFDSLTELANMSSVEESLDLGGDGFLSMLSLMTGTRAQNDFASEMVEFNNIDDTENDEMVIRFGGSNNFVEDDREDQTIAENERNAMLCRLDDMLVVPPEYEIPTSESEDIETNGQFDDAEESDSKKDDNQL